jgi:hypothetical protein
MSGHQLIFLSKPLPEERTLPDLDPRKMILAGFLAAAASGCKSAESQRLRQRVSADDFKAPADERGDPVHFLLANVAFELAVPYGLNERQQLVPVPAGLQFHPAVRKIANPAGHLEPAGFPPDTMPEADTLYMSLKE